MAEQHIALIEPGLPETAPSGFLGIDVAGSVPVLKYAKTVTQWSTGKPETIWISLDNSDSSSLDRPASMSDLEYQLRKRDWNIPERYYEAAGDLCLYISDGDLDPIPSIKAAGIKDKIGVMSDVSDQDAVDEFLSNYRTLTSIRPKMIVEGSSVDFGNTKYYNLISLRDIVRDISVIDLVSLGGSKYTNIINLNSLPLGEGTIKVGLAWTKDGQVYTGNVDFSLDNTEGWQRKLQSDILLEYIDGCLRVFPESTEITECIISFCYMTYYGGLV